VLLYSRVIRQSIKYSFRNNIAAFKEGLVEGLLVTYIRHHPAPVTPMEWKDVVRDEEQSYYSSLIWLKPRNIRVADA
jgi:hypothetical protein